MELRVSLIIIGVAIILAIYYLGRRGLRSDESRVTSPASEYLSEMYRRVRERLIRDVRPVYDEYESPPKPRDPVIDPSELDQLETMIPGHDPEQIGEEEIPPIVELGSEQIAPAGEQLFIALTLMAKNDNQFSGDRIVEATGSLGMLLKEDGIYRLEVEDGQGYRQVLLGLANILEPGSFDSATLQELQTPGLVLYLHLPAPLEAREAFERLLETGNALKQLLDAELCDEARSVLNKQTIGHLREKIEAFRFKQKMTQVQRRRS